ncbi:MAG: winged helix-turn-helix transcriptional regulator [Rhodobacteraceae bacterium]|nr:winged helix-turn-helix transcriptional regulator [Paracoccaceae bacterium]
MDEKTPPFVANYLLYLLAASSERASAQFHTHVRKAGLRVPEWRVLACLADGDALMITRLADLALMEQSRMTRIVDQMSSRGLVERVADAGDKRRVRVRLTEQGQTIADRLVEDAKAQEVRLLSEIADTDAAAIKSVLKSLLTKLAQPDP